MRFLNQRMRENGRTNVFMTKSPRKNVLDVGIDLGAACMPSGHASDGATTPGQIKLQAMQDAPPLQLYPASDKFLM